MRYIALLRGINVGGNSIIKMADLKKLFEERGLRNVSTYINSGNVIFETEEKEIDRVTKGLEESLGKKLNISSSIIVISDEELKNIMNTIPNAWKTKEDLRKYIAFVKKPFTVKEVMKEIELNEGVDFAEEGPHSVYMSTLMSGLTKSKFTKLIGKKSYKFITMRNYNTAKKLLELVGN